MVLHSTEVADPLPPGDLRQLIYDSLKTSTDAVFMIDGLAETKLTYRELYEKAVSVAMFLNKSGVGDGSVVAIMCDPSCEATAFVAGVWLSGATFCALNPSLTPGVFRVTENMNVCYEVNRGGPRQEEVHELLDISKPKLIFCQENHLTVLESALSGDDGKPQIVTESPHKSYVDINTAMNQDPSQFRMGTYDPEESIIYITFTSGTTGVPKGVICNSRSAKGIAFKMRVSDAGFMITSPMYWISYIASVLCTLVGKGKLIVPGVKYIHATDDVEMTRILDCVQKYKPSTLFTMPSILLRLCNIPEKSCYDLSSLERVIVGGSHLPSSQRRQICEDLFGGRNIVYNGYGASEVGGMSFWPDNKAPDHDSPRSGSVGKLSHGFSLKVLDVDTGEELGPGKTGELAVKSNTIMKGYVNHPERYTPDDWYRTGDLGYYDEEGYIYYTGRLKEIMKYRGFHIAPVELEKIIIQHPQVQEACVVGRPHPIDGERPAAFIVRKSNSLTEKDIHDLVDERVVDPKKLRGGVFFVESIPKNPTGKVLRRELVQQFENMADE